jgi:sugar/nucleoside kinase (ribokinase family)
MTHTDHPLETGSEGLRSSVVGSGLLALDIVMSEISGEPPRQWAGGSCGNVLVALSYLGWESKPVARLKTGGAAARILFDLKQWGVSDQFISLAQDGSTPVIVERITRGSGNIPRHSFSWRCPECGSQFPGFKAVRTSVAEEIVHQTAAPQVFFFDRATSSSLLLARVFAEQGTLIVFEPSGIGNSLQFRQAWETSHIVKYSHERLRELPEIVVQRSPLLQVETLGESGLRYRKVQRSGRGGRWIELKAFHVDVVRDTAGSGDWCTAGLIDAGGHKGAEGFFKLKDDELKSALRYGQALAAWNCGYEGARGGMYAVDRRIFREQVAHILEGGSDLIDSTLPIPPTCNSYVGGFCPACDTTGTGKSATGTSGPVPD